MIINNWCPYLCSFVDCDKYCAKCNNYLRRDSSYDINEINYECPDCHGKFRYAAIDGCRGYVCPFCAREMKGLK